MASVSAVFDFRIEIYVNSRRRTEANEVRKHVRSQSQSTAGCHLPFPQMPFVNLDAQVCS